MLTENNYNKGIQILEQIKYNIAYDKAPLFDIVYCGLAMKLLNHEYNNELTEEQRSALQEIANK